MPNAEVCRAARDAYVRAARFRARMELLATVFGVIVALLAVVALWRLAVNGKEFSRVQTEAFVAIGGLVVTTIFVGLLKSAKNNQDSAFDEYKDACGTEEAVSGAKTVQSASLLRQCLLRVSKA